MRNAAVFAALAALGLVAAGAAEAAGAGASGFSWNGVYVGFQGGYNSGTATTAYDTPTPPFNVAIGPMHPKGGSAGIEGGINYEFTSHMLVGFETDLSWGNVADTVPDLAGGPPFTLTAKTDSGGTVRGRLGLVGGAGTLLYGTGGLAWIHSTVSATDGPLKEASTIYGWTAGGGIEQALGAKVSIKIEDLYSHYDNHTWFAGAPWQSSGSSWSNAIRVGLNLHF